MQGFVNQEQGREYALKILNTRPKIMRVAFFVIVFALAFSFYAAVMYAHYDCEGSGYAWQIAVTSFVFFAFLHAEKRSNSSKNNPSASSSSRLRLSALVLLITMILVSNMIADQSRKTICGDVTICHKNPLLQENIDIMLTSLRRERNFCHARNTNNQSTTSNPTSDESRGGRREQNERNNNNNENEQQQRVRSNKEEDFEKTYMDSLNQVWSYFCQFYDQMSKSNENCASQITADRVFINTELKGLKIVVGVSLVLFLLIAFELVLQVFYPEESSSQQQHSEFYMKSDAIASAEIIQNPLIDLLSRKSSLANQQQSQNNHNNNYTQRPFGMDLDEDLQAAQSTGFNDNYVPPSKKQQQQEFTLLELNDMKDSQPRTSNASLKKYKNNPFN